MSTCVGIEGQVQIAWQQDGTYYQKELQKWIDPMLADPANASKITNVDAAGAIQQLDVSDKNWLVWATDQQGLPREKKVTMVQRTDLTKLSPDVKKIFLIATNNGTQCCVGYDTLLVTRVNNQVGCMPANQFDLNDPEGCMWGCNLSGFILRTDGPQPVQYPVQPWMQVPHVETATWGGLLMTRQNCADAMDVCDNYPDAVDPGDRAVFDEALTEILQYDPIYRLEQIDYFQGRYLYHLDTEWGNWMAAMNSFLVGVPHISPLSKPTMPKAVSSGEHKVGDKKEMEKTLQKYKAKLSSKKD